MFFRLFVRVLILGQRDVHLGILFLKCNGYCMVVFTLILQTGKRTKMGVLENGVWFILRYKSLILIFLTLPFAAPNMSSIFMTIDIVGSA